MDDDPHLKPRAEAAPRFGFDNSYIRLSERLFARCLPLPVAAPRLLRLNTGLAEALGLDPEALASPEGVAVLAGNALPEGAEPVALAYAGHQFGHFTPSLGDGRAVLLGEIVTPRGERRDIQLKGSGATPFSRRGDGRSALGPVLREYLVSEAMHALGIPTTRSLAAVATGEAVFREAPLPGGVLTRVAASHIRIGTFQYLAARQDLTALKALLDYAIARHDPAAAEAATPALAFLEGVIARQAELIARWLAVGFIHGVMNTDNMTVSGETLDFGPCAFMDAYHPGQVFSSIDYGGRYAYGEQPRIALWNLARLAEALLPLIAADEAAALERAREAIGGFTPRFRTAYHALFAKKLGLRQPDEALMQGLLDAMTDGQADFTLTFRRLCDAAIDPAADDAVRRLFADAAPYDAWAADWRAALAAQDGADPAVMRRANPALIPRNHRIEEAIEAAVQRDDFTRFEELVEAWRHPFDPPPAFAHLEAPPAPAERVTATFCGT
jgi:uncharacterized protein YdiU (UPF0061 family)